MRLIVAAAEMAGSTRYIAFNDWAATLPQQTGIGQASSARGVETSRSFP